MSTINLIGLSPDDKMRPPLVSELVGRAKFLAGGDRLLDLFPDFTGQKIPLKTPLEDWLRELDEKSNFGEMVILTSGDPNFFGLAKKLLTVIDGQKVQLIPSPTTVQLAFAHLKKTWAGAEVVSLHGRHHWGDLWAALLRSSHFGSGLTAIYTDKENSPALIAQKVLAKGLNFRLHVFEELGQAGEKISSLDLAEASSKDFSPLNLCVLESIEKPAPIVLGQSEEAYLHEAGLITKAAVRAVALGFLELLPHHIMWDLGAGSGSVAIEAARQLFQGGVWAVEKNQKRLEHIFQNRQKFGAANLEIVSGEALEVLDELPAPDRVFLGGGGYGLGELIEKARRKLKPGGLIVASLVGLDSLASARLALKTKDGQEPQIVQVNINLSAPLAGSLYFKPQNQVYLLKASI